MVPRSVRLGVPLAMGLLLAGSVASAQTQSRGAMHVLGLRAPDGDNETATLFSQELRGAARTQGYQVPDNSPGLEQEVALLGCTSTGPDCLAQISQDLNTPKFIYGTVQRIGRGRNAQLSLEISLWDQSGRREVDRQTATISREQGRDQTAIREIAQRMAAALALRDVAAPTINTNVVTPPNGNGNTGGNGNVGNSGGKGNPPPPPPPPPPQSHTWRYVGYGVLGVGSAALIVGVVQWIRSNGQNGDTANATVNSPGELGAWARYDTQYVSMNRGASPADVCNAAQSDSSLDAVAIRGLCSSNSTTRTTAFALGIGGAVLAAAGAVLVILDPGSSPEQPAATPSPRQARNTLRWNVSPVISPTVNGASLSLTF